MFVIRVRVNVVSSFSGFAQASLAQSLKRHMTLSTKRRRRYFSSSIDPTFSAADQRHLPVGGLGSLKQVTPSYIARLSDINRKRIRSLTGTPERYQDSTILNEDGSSRPIVLLDEQLKTAQARINKHIFSQIRLPEFVECSPGRSFMTHALRHRGAHSVLTMDLSSYYPSVSHRQVRIALARVGCSSATAEVLTRLTTRNGSLPQGSPTSSFLANLVGYFFIDRRIASMCDKYRWSYSRYMDDIALSGPKGIKRIRGLVKKIISEATFRISEKEKKKMRVSELGKEKIEITGLRVTRYISSPEKTQELNRQVSVALLYGWRKAWLGISKKKAQQKLHGSLHYLMHLDGISDRPNGPGHKLFRRAQRIQWT